MDHHHHCIYDIKDVIDCCSFSDYAIFLLSNGKILCHYKFYKTIYCNRKLKHILSFNNELYGVDKYGNLYVLSMKYFDYNYWVFIRIENIPMIESISVTLDDNYMYIHNNNNNYIYDCNFNVVDKYKSDKFRIYGNNLNTYLSFNNNKCSIYVDDVKIQVIDNVLSGVIDYKNDVFLLKTEDIYLYTNIKLLNHIPYYIDV